MQTVHFIRHGEGWHNIGWEDNLDAHLTDHGWRQAAALGEHIRRQQPPLDIQARTCMHILFQTPAQAVSLCRSGPCMRGLPPGCCTGLLHLVLKALCSMRNCWVGDWCICGVLLMSVPWCAAAGGRFAAHAHMRDSRRRLRGQQSRSSRAAPHAGQNGAAACAL